MVSRLGFVPLQVSVLLRELNSLQPYMMSRERHANGSRSSLIISAHCGTPCEWFTCQLYYFFCTFCCFISYSCMELFGISLFTRFRQCLSSSTMVGGVRGTMVRKVGHGPTTPSSEACSWSPTVSRPLERHPFRGVHHMEKPLPRLESARGVPALKGC